MSRDPVRRSQEASRAKNNARLDLRRGLGIWGVWAIFVDDSVLWAWGFGSKVVFLDHAPFQPALRRNSLLKAKGSDGRDP